MHVRLAAAADAQALALAHPLPRETTVPEPAFRGFCRAKVLIYTGTPGAGIVTGWVDGRVAGFMYYCLDLREVTRSSRSPRRLLWMLKEALLGRFGFSPRFWLQMARSAVQHFRGQRGAPAGPSEADRRAEEFRSWITGLETVPEFRRLGVATAILDGIEAVLAELGARYIALWVAVENEVACEIYARRGYREVAVLPRIGEDCRLMVKDVGVTLDQAAGEDG